MASSTAIAVICICMLSAVCATSIEDIGTLVHLYEWRYSDIAKECEDFLAPNGYKGVQVSPVTENIIINNRPWWEKYQLISYKIASRAGNENDFKDMVSRCNKVEVNIYVDIVLNDMSGTFVNAKGTGGSTADTANLDYPAVPFTKSDFHPKCACNQWNNATNVRNCELNGLHDLNMTSTHVRKVQIDFLNHLLDLGVAGFRVDAAKHMWPEDLEYIFSQLKNTKTKNGGKPFIYFMTLDLGGEGTHYYDYTSIGPATDFRYGLELGKTFRGGHTLSSLKNWGPEWKLFNSSDSIVFLHNHDNNRGSGTGTPYVLTYKDGALFKKATAFMLAWPHGIPRVMSSYAFKGWGDGAPMDSKENTLPVVLNSDNSCSNGWNCEHRYKEIAAMVQFKNVVKGTKVKQWYDNGNNQVAFCRGNKGFVAYNLEYYNFDKTLKVCLPPGKYCDVISGKLVKGKCTGKVIRVNRKRNAHIKIPNYDPNLFIAIHIKSKIRKGSNNLEEDVLNE